MRIDNIFNYTNIMGVAMQGNVVRQNAISNNIANVDTPGFKRSRVDFEDSLAVAVNNFNATGRLDLSFVQPRISTEFDHLRYRWDENNVDIELEMVQLYQTGMRFNVISSGIMNHYRIVNMVIAMV